MQDSKNMAVRALEGDGDTIYRQAAIDALTNLQGIIYASDGVRKGISLAWNEILKLPSAQPEYKPVTAEDFAKTMSENTIYQYMVWHGVALVLMKEQGFVICKKTM